MCGYVFLFLLDIKLKIGKYSCSMFSVRLAGDYL